MERYQQEDPNNSRIYIDYNAPEGERARFSYVDKEKSFLIAYRLWFLLLYFKPPFIGLFLIMLSSIPFYYIHHLAGLTYIALSYFLIPLILALIVTKNRKLKLKMPYLNFLASGHCYQARFNPYDIKDNKIEIPMFRNVLLEYEATGEFSKYLSTLEIVEHPFDLYVMKRFRPSFKKRNPYLWKAVFTFKETPKTGDLKVRFV